MAQHMSMSANAGETTSDNPKHARELAQQLVRHLGIQGAMRTCRENHWQGVLHVVETLAPKV